MRKLIVQIILASGLFLSLGLSSEATKQVSTANATSNIGVTFVGDNPNKNNSNNSNDVNGSNNGKDDSDGGFLTLPQTGEVKGSLFAILGTVILTLTLIIINSRRKKNEKINSSNDVK